MNDGLWLIDGQRRVQLSKNPDALNPRNIARAMRQALADVQASPQEGEAVTAHLSWTRDLLQYAGIDSAALTVIEAALDGADAYRVHGAPRTVPTVQAPDDPGEQAAF